MENVTNVEIANKLNDVIELQSKLNVSTNGSDWESGKTQDGRTIDWHLCMIMEANEAIDSLNWKHWKDKDKPDDMNNFRMEITDIFHFLISENIVRGTCDSLLPIVSKTLSVDKVILDKDELIVNLKQFIYWVIYSESDMPDSKQGFIIANEIFFYIVHNTVEFSFDELYKLYIGKNVLNVFRQENGYDEGTYKKVFGEVGSEVEDNVWLTKYLNTNTNPSYDSIMAYLNDIYSKYTK